MLPGPQRRRREGSTRGPAASPALVGAFVVLAAVLVIQACTNRDITSVVVTEVSVTPPNASLVEGDTLRFRAVVTDDRGGTLNGASVEWSVGESTIASVDADGLVRALSTGTTTIRAEFQGVSGEATVEVLPAPRIGVDPSSLSFFGGIGGAPIPSQDVSISNASSDIRLEGLEAEVQYTQDQPAGWLDVSLAGQTAPTTLTATPVTAGLPPGQYSADIVITTTTRRVENSPLTIPVTLSLSDFLVEETDGSTVVDEAGSQDQFSVALGKAPTSDVVLTVTSGDTGEVTVDVAQLTFTPDDWDVPQVVTVTGVDDLVDDGDVQTSVTISVDDANSDDAFDPTPDFEVVVTTLDDDTAGMVVAETDGSTVVTEAGGTDTFSVVLQTEPASLVVIDVSSQAPEEVSVAPDQLSFDASNWDEPQVVTVTGEDDSVIDGPQTSDVSVSVNLDGSDEAYHSVASETVEVTTEDDDVGGIVLSRDAAAVDETGTVDSVMVSLSVMPDSAVVLTATSDDLTEVTVSPDTLTIEPSEWNVGQAIRFTGVNDQLSDGAQVATVTVSVVTDASDGDFSAAPDVTVDVTNADDDAPGFTVTETDGATTVSESGTTDDFQVVLRTQPRQDSVVVLEIESPDPGETTVSPTSVTFDHTDWDQPRTVTVTGVDDGEDDGDQVTDVEISVGAGTSDPDYASVSAQTVPVTTLDTKLVVAEIGGGTTVVTEFGGTDFIEVALSHQPTSDVVVSVVSDDTGEVTVDKAQLTFTPDNWSTAQTVQVEGVDDDIDDGDILTDVRLTVVNGSSDPIFHDVADTVQVTTTDNDGAGIDVIELGGTVVLEGGDTDDFGVRLTAEPAPGTIVVLDVSSGDTGEVTVDKAQLTFTPADWDQQQVVRVTGVADNTVDGDQNTDVTISVNGATTDPAYPSVDDRIVSVTTEDIDTAAVTVNNASATEGSGLTFTVTLSDAVEGGLSVNVTLTDGTAVAPADYDGAGETLSFTGAAGQTRQFTVSTVDDDILEADETFTVSLDASDPGVTDSDTGTGTIVDNDEASVTVNNRSATEGSGLTFTVTLDNPVADGLTVDVTFTDVSATGGATPLVSPEDYQNVVGQLSFAGTAGETEQFTVATLDDDIVEGSETFTVSLSASNPAVTDNDTGTGTIVDNDEAAVTVNDASNDEGSGLAFTVTLDNPVAGGMTVDVTLTDVSATGGATPLVSPEDYNNVVGQLTFVGTAGETESFTVATLDDDIFEGPETFTVGLSASNGAVDDSDGATGTILDNDSEPSVTLSASPLNLAENGSDNPSVVTATLSNPSTQNVTVSLGFSGTASAGDDYTRSGTSIVIPAGSTSRSIDVDAAQDAIDETDETVVIDITGVTNGTESGTQRETITIVDDDDAPSVTLSASPLNLAEDGSDNPSVVTATLSNPSTQDVTVTLGFSGDATLTDDYTRTGTSIVISAGSTSGTIEIGAVDDSGTPESEPDEEVVIDITDVTNGTESGTQQETITIVDDDAAPSVTLSASPLSLAEDGSDNPSVVTATLSNPSTQDVTVTLGFSGDAMLTDDYTRTGTSIVISAGLTSGTIEIGAVDDSGTPESEPDEEVVIDITDVTNGTESGTQQETVTIVDDDSAPSVTLSASPLSLAEDGSDNPSVVTASLSNTSSQEVSVSLGFSGSATLTADYTRTGTSIVIPPGSTSGTIEVAAVDDSGDPEFEPDEEVVIDITDVTNGTESGTQQETITIVDDDDAPSVTLSASPLTLAEDGSDNPSVVTATLSNTSTQDVTVSLGFSGDAMLTDDYTRTGTSILIPAGLTSGTIEIGAVDDSGTPEPEPDEEVVIAITDVTNGTESGTQQETITIVDDDLVSGEPARVEVTQQPSSTAQSGVAFARQPVVLVTDNGGSPVPDETVTATIASGDGSLGGTLTVTTDGSGEAAFTDLSISGLVGPRTLGFSAGSVGDISNTIDLEPGPLDELVVSQEPSSTATNDEPFPQQPTVTAFDDGGNALSGISVTVEIASGGGTLDGTLSVSTDGSGAAAFTDLKITGTVGTRTLSFFNGATSVTSSSIDVVAGAPETVTISQQPPAFAVDGATFTRSPIVAVEDVSGNPVPGVDVVASIETGSGSLNGTTTIATSGGGSATFSTLSLTGSAGERTLRFTSEGVQSVSDPVHLSLAAGSYEDLQYCGSDPLQRLDVYVPDSSFPRPLPVVAYVHGGSWISHDKSEEDLLLWANVRAELLSRGYVVTTLNYRLATTSDASTEWPAQIQDVKCAVRHLRADGADYGTDGDRIGVWGASAGGHLVAMLGVTDGVSPTVHDFEAGPTDYSGTSSSVQATITIAGISDMTATQANLGHPELDVSGTEVAFSSWPGPSTELNEASPIWWASSDDPPFLIIHGEEDATVDVAQGQRLFDYLDLEGAGVVELERVTNAGHELEDVTGPATPSISQLVQRVSDFFDTHVASQPVMLTSSGPGQ